MSFYPIFPRRLLSSMGLNTQRLNMLSKPQKPMISVNIGLYEMLQLLAKPNGLEVMEDLVRQKFTRYPDLGSKLLATGDAELIEGNTWSDKFYGAIWDSKQEQWVGENHLGKILMKIRAELQEQS